MAQRNPSIIVLGKMLSKVKENKGAIQIIPSSATGEPPLPLPI